MRLFLLPFLLPFPAAALADPAAAPAPPDFLREVRPILSGYCLKCHGPDQETRKGGLRLDVREDALKPAKSGEAAIVPGNPDASELLKRVFTTDPDEIMPPPSAKHELTGAQKDILRRWVIAGADYRPHWAFVAPAAQTPPEVKHPEQVRGPVDRFIVAHLEKEGLSPTAEADRLTLCRRVYLDLTGLPPTPEEADAFVNDPAPDAWERLVDRLLASPHYGERWARRWLDLARYADTNGFEKDRVRSIWPWRDWVVESFNADLPFDQFTIQQLAGDMLPEATRAQITATGFHRNTMLNEEGGVDPLEYRWLATVDRVSTTATAWMGLTLGCAQCHTHKYDPILHTEYYQVMAFLNNAEEPDLELPPPGAEKRRADRAAEAARLLAGLPDQWPAAQSDAVEWVTAPATGRAASGAALPRQADGSFLLAAPGPARETLTITLRAAPGIWHALRLDTLTDDSLPSGGPGRTPHGNFVLGEISAAVRTANGLQPLSLTGARSDVSQATFSPESTIDGNPATGWAVDVRGQGGKLHAPHWLTVNFAAPLVLEAETEIEITLDQSYGGGHTIGRPRIGIGRRNADTPPSAAGGRGAAEAAFAGWLARQRTATIPWQTRRPASADGGQLRLAMQPDNSVYASGDSSKDDRFRLVFRDIPAGTTAIRLEALPDERLPAGGPGMTYYEGPKGDFFLGELTLTDGAQQPIKVASASHSYAKNNFGGNASAAAAVDGDAQSGWTCAGRFGEAHEAVFILAAPFAGGDLHAGLQFGRHFASTLGRFRISTTNAAGAAARDLPTDIKELLAKTDASLTAADRDALREQFLMTAPQLAAQAEKIRQLRQPEAVTTTLVLRERPPENPRATMRHHRGEYLQPEERVEPGVPGVLPPLPPDAPRNRLGFARWLVSRENPLTARVTVNREWAAFFGTGIVKTVDDFGYQGEMPSHPDLLDWLAVEFMNGCPSLPGQARPWSLKRLHRLIVTSAAYRRSSSTDPALQERDPANRLLARGPRFRMEAEMIRDSALLAAGLLSPAMGGPGVFPPQPAGVTTEGTYGSLSWQPSTGPDRWRRSLYTFAKRTAPFAAYTTFDAPSGEACLARRDVSNTPLQALTLLNDVVFIEAAQALGRQAAALPGTDSDRTSWLFRRILTRPPAVEESARLDQFRKNIAERIAAGELKAADLAGPAPESGSSAASTDDASRAVWTALARALLSLHETVVKG